MNIGESVMQPQETSSPWYIRVMLGISGWIGALFLMGFTGIAFEVMLRNPFASAVMAALCCGASFFIFRTMPNSDFAGQFGLAIGLVGQILWGMAIFKEFNGNHAAGYFLFFLVEVILTAVMPSFMHRLFTTLGGLGALSLGFGQAGFHGLAAPLMAAGCAWIWREELLLAKKQELWQPVGYGLALGLLQSTTLSLSGAARLFRHHDTGSWLLKHASTIETALIAVVFLVVAAMLLLELEIEAGSSTWTVVLASAFFAMMASFPIHGLSVALLVLVLGFARGNRILLALGLLAMAVFMAIYYYQMKETLLYKSMMLGLTGALLLGGRQTVRLLLPAGEVKGHA